MDFGWSVSDTPTSLLVGVHLIQMIIIIVLLLPFVDTVTLSKHIKDFSASVKNSSLTLSVLVVYAFIVIFYGILSPTKILTELKYSKQVKGERPEDILRRIITCTNASRNYILGAFSLFYLLVILRLFDLVTFSAKLYELSELLGNYDLVDITLIDEPDFKSSKTSLIDEIIEEEDEDVPWPITADFNKAERSQIRTFLKDPPKKLTVLASKVKSSDHKNYNNTPVRDSKDKTVIDTEVDGKRSNKSINEKPNSGVDEIIEIVPSKNKNIDRTKNDPDLNNQEIDSSHDKKNIDNFKKDTNGKSSSPK